MLEQLNSIDTSIFLLLNTGFANPFFDFFFKTITKAQFWIIPGIIAAILFIVKEKKNALIVIGLAALTVAITDPLSARIMKPFFGRLRPCNPDVLVEGGRFLMGFKSSLSFPSSHAMNIFAQAALLSLFYPRWIGIYFSFASLIGLSRIYVGVHYPADVVAGAFSGIIVALIVFYGYIFCIQHIQSKKKQTTNY